jgi:hypothetical protein
LYLHTPSISLKQVLNGEIGPEGRQFDAVVTYSSLEHGGLGRYGDELNPWADLIAMAKAWCLTKSGGRMLIGLPTGPDEVKRHRPGLDLPKAYKYQKSFKTKYYANDFS